MTAYALTPRARRDVLEIGGYIATFDPDAALRLEDRLRAAMMLLATRPDVGHWRDDLISRHAAVRFWTVASYLIIYRKAPNGIEVVRVLHGRRDVKSVLRPLAKPPT